MAVQTLTVPTADEQQKFIYNRKVKAGNTEVLDVDQKFAVILLEFDPEVTDADYPAIAAGVRGVAGVASASMLVDGVAPSSVPENTEVKLVTEVQLRIDDLLEE